MCVCVCMYIQTYIRTNVCTHLVYYVLLCTCVCLVCTYTYTCTHIPKAVYPSDTCYHLLLNCWEIQNNCGTLWYSWPKKSQEVDKKKSIKLYFLSLTCFGYSLSFQKNSSDYLQDLTSECNTWCSWCWFSVKLD